MNAIDVPNLSLQAARDEFSRLYSFRARKRRTMRQFAEEMINLPTGRYKGLRFKIDRQPFMGAFFDAVDSGKYRRIIVTGNVQSGKTFMAVAIPIIYHLVEFGDTLENYVVLHGTHREFVRKIGLVECEHGQKDDQY